MLTASTRLASATSDNWKAPGIGRRPNDNARELLRVGLPSTEEDRGLGFPLPIDWLPPAISTDLWLWHRARFSFDTDHGLAKALWASNFPRITKKSWRSELTFEHSHFP